MIAVPAIDRFYILPFHDLYTVYSGYVSAATTGTGPGRYLFAGPSWTGGTPDGFDCVLTASTEFVGCRAAQPPPTATSKSCAASSSPKTPSTLHEHHGTPAPASPPVAWPAWQEAAATDLPFYDYLDHLLEFAPVLDEDRAVRNRMATVGLDGTRHLRQLNPQRRGPRRVRARPGRRHRAPGPCCLPCGELDRVVRHPAGDGGAIRQPQRRGEEGPVRAAARAAWYGGWLVDAAGNPISGHTDYTITFTADQLPKARFFWSATLYTLPQRLLSANEIDRYSIGDRTPGVRYRDDGSLTLHIQHRAPTTRQAAANWLPSPKALSPSSSAPTAATP